MTNTERYMLELLGAFAEETAPEIHIVPDTALLFDLSKRQGVVGIIAYMMNRYGLYPDSDTADKFNHEYERTVMQMVGRTAMAKRVFAKLNREGVPHILFKGTTVSEVYPVTELRTFGDVDVIILSEDVQRVRDILIAEGYAHYVADEGVVNVFKKGREMYEFHTALNVSNVRNNDYFDDIWGNTEVVDGNTLRFNHNFHLSYLICHLEKHVYGSGAGVRMYLDIALYLRKYRDKIDLDAVRDTLSLCGLDRFLNTVLSVCSEWFSTDIPSDVVPLDDNIYRDMCEFTLNGGVFGDQSDSAVLEDSLRREFSVGKKGARLRLLLSRIFPPVYELYRLYPKYENKPLLVPIAWICHVANVLSNKKISRVKQIASADVQSAERRKRFLDSIGSTR